MVIIEYFVYLAFRVFVFLVNLLPEAFVRPLGVFGGQVIYLFDKRDRRTIMSNLQRAFGDAKTEKEYRRVTRAVFRNLVLNSLGSLRLKRYGFKDIKGMVEPVNLHYVDETMKRGKGLIFVTAHFGNWEYLGLMGAAVLERYKVISVGRTLKNRFIDQYIKSLREYTGNRIIPKKDAAFELMRGLKRNDIVCLFADQVGGNESVLVDFFGSKVLTVSAPAYFSFKTGAPVIPAFLCQENDKYRLIFERPIEPDLSRSYESEVLRITSAYTKVIENYIRRYPEQWFWFHKRWKSKRAKKIYSNSYKIIVHAPNWIGDAVMSIPAVKGIRDLFPNSKITLLAKEKVSPVFQNNPYLDRIVALKGGNGLSGLIDNLKTVSLLREEKYDLGILFPNSFRSALLFSAGGVRQRVGYGKDGRGLLLTRCLKRDSDILKLHHRDYYFRIAREIGNVSPSGGPRIFLSEEEVSRAKGMIASLRKGNGPLIGINPGGAYGPAKRWPAKSYGELAALLNDRLCADVVVFGSEADREIAAEIIAVAKKDMIDMTGKTDLTSLAASLKASDILVTNDSGPMHIAAAVGTPVVAIFGSTNPAATSPAGEHIVVTKNLRCAPCLRRTCDIDYECMKAISVLDVFTCVEKLLAKSEKKQRGAL